MNEPRTLAIDIGGTGIKAALLDDAGTMIGERQRVPTPPKPVSPEDLVRAIDQVAGPLGTYERVSVGFPGYVRDGRVVTAPNLGTETLAGFDLQQALSEHWSKPVRVLNDADVQAKWYYRLKNEYARARAEGRPFANPVKERILRWRS